MNLRKEAVDEQERNLKVVLADAKAEQAEKRSQDIFNLVSIVFKNPVVRQHTSGSMPVAQGKDQYGCLQPIVPSPFNQTVETEVEGSK